MGVLPRLRIAASVAALALVLLATLAARSEAQLAARTLLRMNGLSPGDHFGLGLAPAGDLNGDGFDDFLVGAAFADGVFGDVGRAYAFLSRVLAKAAA